MSHERHGKLKIMKCHFDEMDQWFEEHFNGHDQICENLQNKNLGNNILSKELTHHFSKIKQKRIIIIIF